MASNDAAPTSAPEGLDEFLSEQDPQEAVAAKGFKQLGQMAYESQPIQNIISGAPLKETYNQALAAGQGDQAAQQAIAEKSLGTAMGTLKSVEAPKRMVPKGTFKAKFSTPAYHGTRADIEAFDPDTLGASTNAQSAKKAFFFAQDPSTASDYAELAPSRADLRARTSDIQSLWNDVEKYGNALAEKYGDKARHPDVYDEMATRYTEGELKDMGISRIPESEPLYQKYLEAKGQATAGDTSAIDYDKEIRRKEEAIAEHTRNSPEQQAKGIPQWEASIKHVNDILSGKKVEAYPRPKEYLEEKLAKYTQYLDEAKQATSPEGVKQHAETLSQLQNELSSLKRQNDLNKTGQNVIPVQLRMENPYIHDFKDTGYRDDSYSNIIDKAKAAGHDSVIFKNTYDPANPDNRVLQDIYAVFEPHQIRSRFAEFNPKKAKSGNISYAQGGEVKMAEGGELPPGFNLDSQRQPALDNPVINQTNGNMSPNMVPNQPHASPNMVPEGLDEFIAPELHEEKYGSGLEQLKAGAEGVAQGLLGPIAPAAEEAIGEALGQPRAVTAENMRGRAEANPISHYAGEIGGLVLPSIVTAGGTAAAKAGMEGLAATLNAGAHLTQAGALEAIGTKAASHIAGDTLAAKVGQAAAKGFVENALLAGSDEASKMVLEDPNTSAETAIATMGIAGVLGAGIGSVAGLWSSKYGPALGKVAADFKGETEFQLAHPDHVGALGKELGDLHASVTEPASEVYGATGLKAQAIKKVLPDLHEGIVNQVNGIVDKFESSLGELQAKGDPHAGLLESKLATLRQGLNTDDTGQIFDALQSMKQAIHEESKFGKMAPLAERPYRDAIKDLGHELRTALEDKSVWGDAATLQQGINSAFKAYLPALQKFESTFMTKVPNVETGIAEPVINAGKVQTFINQLGKPSAEIKQSFLENFLQASNKYKGEINKLYDKLGVESPIKETSTAAINHALEDPTLGSKIARAFYGKALSDAGATSLGAGIGAAAGHAIGLSHEIGAIIGSQALGPFFKSVLPGIAKAMVTGEVNSPALKAAIDYAAAVSKGNELMSKAAKNVFKVESEVIPESYMPKEKDRAKMEKALVSMQSNPQGFMNQESKLAHYLPEHNTSVAASVGTISNVLNMSRAFNNKKLPLDGTPVLSPVEKAAQAHAMNIAQQPLLVLDKIKKGTITSKDIVLLNQMYPNLTNKLRSKLFDEMTSHISKGGEIPYKLRAGLSMFSGQPMDSTLTPSSIMAAQIQTSTGAPMPQQQGQPKAKGVKSSPALQKMPNMYQTSGQARAQRANKE